MEDEEEEELNGEVGSTGADSPSKKKVAKWTPTMLYLFAKYTLDLCFCEDKEIQLAVFVDD